MAEEDAINDDHVYLRVLSDIAPSEYQKDRLRKIADKLEQLEKGYRVIKEEPDDGLASR